MTMEQINGLLYFSERNKWREIIESTTISYDKNTNNKLKIVASGTYYDVYLDDIVGLINIKASTLTHGSIGLYTFINISWHQINCTSFTSKVSILYDSMEME